MTVYSAYKQTYKLVSLGVLNSSEVDEYVSKLLKQKNPQSERDDAVRELEEFVGPNIGDYLNAQYAAISL